MAADALFIADLHLQVSKPATVALARQFLQQVAPQSPQLFILGDLVEYWVGDDADDGTLADIFNDLRQLGNNDTQVSLMHGNRDFLLGPAFAERTGLTLIPNDSFVFEHAGQSVLLMHGDTLCTDDNAYQSMRKQLRSSQWQQTFLARSIEQRRAFAAELRNQSKALSAQKDKDIMDVNEDSVQATLREAGVYLLVHGHTHKPAQHTLTVNGHNATRFVVGDWQPDHAMYATLQDGKLALHRFTG